MDSQSIIVQANRDESCTEFPILSLPRPVPPTPNTQGLLPSCFSNVDIFVHCLCSCSVVSVPASGEVDVFEEMN